MVDTLGAVVRKYFSISMRNGVDSCLEAKTFDLKSAYRQIAIHEEHLRCAYFSVYNHEIGGPEVYQLVTLPFGAVRSVYNFLRLSKMLHSVAARSLCLVNTNFYDDFVLVSKPACALSAGNSMEVLFMLLGWEYARDGKKATSFATVCQALGVEFDFSRSEQRLLCIQNTEQRRLDLIQKISQVLSLGCLTKQEALVSRGRLGFADSFLHGRLGKLTLKRILDHAYSRKKELDGELIAALLAMKTRLEQGRPSKVTEQPVLQWFVYTDASFVRTCRNVKPYTNRSIILTRSRHLRLECFRKIGCALLCMVAGLCELLILACLAGGISAPALQEINYYSPGRVISTAWKVKKRCFHSVVLEGDIHIGKVKWVKSGRATKASLIVREKGKKRRRKRPIREVTVVVPSRWSFLERLESKQEEIQGDQVCALVAQWKFWELVA